MATTKKKIAISLVLIILISGVIYLAILINPKPQETEQTNASLNETMKDFRIIEASFSIKPSKRINRYRYAMAIGEESTLLSQIDFLKNISANISLNLPRGVKHIGGELSWHGAGNKTPLVMENQIMAVKVGRWALNVKVNGVDYPKEDDEPYYLCVGVTKEDAVEKCK